MTSASNSLGGITPEYPIQFKSSVVEKELHPDIPMELPKSSNRIITGDPQAMLKNLQKMRRELAPPNEMIEPQTPSALIAAVGGAFLAPIVGSTVLTIFLPVLLPVGIGMAAGMGTKSGLGFIVGTLAGIAAAVVLSLYVFSWVGLAAVFLLPLFATPAGWIIMTVMLVIGVGLLAASVWRHAQATKTPSEEEIQLVGQQEQKLLEQIKGLLAQNPEDVDLQELNTRFTDPLKTKKILNLINLNENVLHPKIDELLKRANLDKKNFNRTFLKGEIQDEVKKLDDLGYFSPEYRASKDRLKILNLIKELSDVSSKAEQWISSIKANWKTAQDGGTSAKLNQMSKRDIDIIYNKKLDKTYQKAEKILAKLSKLGIDTELPPPPPPEEEM